MEDEIANQTFAYPSSELARMLSPKRLKPNIKATKELPLLHQYDCCWNIYHVTRNYQTTVHMVCAL